MRFLRLLLFFSVATLKSRRKKIFVLTLYMLGHFFLSSDPKLATWQLVTYYIYSIYLLVFSTRVTSFTS